MSEPSAEFQLEFLQRYQRLLDSGGFVATYKYALLIALCNLAAEEGFDDDREQPIPVIRLGEQFLRLYWTHTRPYPGLDHPLRQNTGQQAAILTTVERARAAVPGADRAEAVHSVPIAYIREATQRVKTMPLWKLQTVGTQKVDPDHPDNFLYPTREVQGCIVLRPGISACLRRFRSLIVSTTQNAWADYVRRTNPELGAGHDLDRFLFGAHRSALHQLAPALLELQHGRCFYTGAPIRTGHVDHFIPWARFAFDSPFNLVVASPTANLQKSDHLAALPHLQRWHQRNTSRREALLTLGAVTDDTERWGHIARFSYSQAARVNSLGWLRGRQMQEISRWAEVLVDGSGG